MVVTGYTHRAQRKGNTEESNKFVTHKAGLGPISPSIGPSRLITKPYNCSPFSLLAKHSPRSNPSS